PAPRYAAAWQHEGPMRAIELRWVGFLFLAGASFVSLGGCFSPSLGDAPFSCGQGGACPSGYSCVSGLCVSHGGPPPGMDAATMPGQDAPMMPSGSNGCGMV